MLASWLHYRSNLQSPWADADHDANAHFLTTWRVLWSAEFAARVGGYGADLASEAHALAATPAEQFEAELWVASGVYWPE